MTTSGLDGAHYDSSFPVEEKVPACCDFAVADALPIVHPRSDGDDLPTVVYKPVFKDRYVLGAVLGEGGMAAVHHAIDRQTGFPVAVKVLRPGSGIPDALQRFEREVGLMSKIRHPHCVRLLDSGTEPAPFAVLELIEGTDLRDAMRRPLPAPQVLELTLQLLRGLEAVHQQGILHRDIKPENLMLTRWADGRDRLVLVDFGAAIVASAAGDPKSQHVVTSVGQILGTPSAMSPEQFSGKPATERSDLYAVGVLMYEMLAGYPPFPDGDFVEVLAAKAKPLPPLPSNVPPSVVWLVSSLLSGVPEQRPDSCAEAIEAVMYARDVLRQTEATSTWIDLLATTGPKV